MNQQSTETLVWVPAPSQEKEGSTQTTETHAHFLFVVVLPIFSNWSTDRDWVQLQ